MELDVSNPQHPHHPDSSRAHSRVSKSLNPKLVPFFRAIFQIDVHTQHERPPNIRSVDIVRKRISGVPSNDNNYFPSNDDADSNR